MPVLRAVFANNPFVESFSPGHGIALLERMKGWGHLIQRLQQGFNVPIDRIPKPEIYLSEQEVHWAQSERSRWPADRPVCILSSRVVTDGDYFRGFDWVSLGKALVTRFTVVQPMINDGAAYRSEVDSRTLSAHWGSEKEVPGAQIYLNLSLRKYLSLFSIADGFCGGTSGGAHAAAAFGVPSSIVVWPDLKRKIRFPCAQKFISPDIFLYPQHRFIATDELMKGHVDENALACFVEELHQRVRDRQTGVADGCCFPDVMPIPVRQNIRQVFVRSGRIRSARFTAADLN